MIHLLPKGRKKDVFLSFMKYLLITNHSYMFWQFRRELAAALLEKGEVVISTPFVGHEEDFRAMGCRCVEVQFDRRGTEIWQNLELLAYYHRLIREEKPDLVVTYSIKPNIFAGLVCRSLKVPYFSHVQGLGTAFERKVVAALVSRLYRFALRGARVVFFENTSDAETFARLGIVSRSKEKILSGAGVNLDYFSFQSYPAEENGVIRFLYLGRIMREKGMDELFRAVRRLQAENVHPFTLDLLGFYEEEEYKSQVAELEASGIVKFHGFQSDPRPYYSAAHCVVMPSYHEGMSNVLLEAASTGRPLITSDIPGCREAVDADRSGFLVPSRDADSLYEAMKRFLYLTAEQRAQMGAAGRKKMEKEFDRTKVLRETVDALTI